MTAVLSFVLLGSGCASTGALLPGSPEGTRAERASEQPSSFTVQAGETVDQAFRRLGQIDRSIYIVVEGGGTSMTGQSAPVGSLTDLTAYLNAYGFDVAVSVKNAPYIQVKVSGNRASPQLVQASCASLSSTTVAPASFKDRSFPEVMDGLLAGTRYTWSAKGSVPKVRITAGSVNGTLAQLLPQLLEQTKTSYSIKDCEVIIGN